MWNEKIENYIHLNLIHISITIGDNVLVSKYVSSFAIQTSPKKFMPIGRSILA